MIYKFIKVTPKLYRGSAPTIHDVIYLKKKYNINKIISLDEFDGNKINDICNKLNIEHIIIPINHNINSINNLLNYDIKELLESNSPTFVHCHAGKDRTGFLIALYKIKFCSISFNEALKEAISLGFGVNIDDSFQPIIQKFKLILKNAYSIDTNDADIVEENYNDNKLFDSCQTNSFAPFMNSHELMPLFQETEIHQLIKTHNIDTKIPESGIFDYNADQPGIRSEFYGEFADMKNKRAYIVSMNYTVSDEEKYTAEKAILCFTHTKNALIKSAAYLDLMLIPFKDNEQITSNELIKNRVQLRKYRDESIELFQQFKNLAFKCVYLMQTFSSDTQIIKQIKSFIAYIDELEVLVNKYANLFSNLEAKEFVKEIIKLIKDIQKKCNNIEELVEQRIIPYVQSNILSKNWVDSVGQSMNLKVQKNKPLNIRLIEKLNKFDQKE